MASRVVIVMGCTVPRGLAEPGLHSEEHFRIGYRCCRQRGRWESRPRENGKALYGTVERLVKG